MEQDEGRVQEIELGGRRRVALDYTPEELKKMTTGKEERKKCKVCGQWFDERYFPMRRIRRTKTCRECIAKAISRGRRKTYVGKKISKGLRKSWKKRLDKGLEVCWTEKKEVTAEPIPMVGLFTRLEKVENRLKRIEKMLFG